LILSPDTDGLATSMGLKRSVIEISIGEVDALPPTVFRKSSNSLNLF
jgi:hypothetical protein